MFHSNLPVQEVLERIKSKLESPENEAALYRFGGQVGTSTFEVWEDVRPGQNSFTPLLKGEVGADQTGTFIRVKMRMNGCAWAFVLIWCYPMVLALSLWMLSVIRGDAGPFNLEAAGSILFLLLMIGFMATISTLGFRSGVQAARAFLQELLGEEFSG